MTEKELKRLSRAELLELLLIQTRETEQLRRKLEKAEAALADRQLRLSNAGDLAQAVLSINGVMEAAQAAAQQYLRDVKASTTVSSLLTRFENETLKVLDKDGNTLSSTSKVGTGATINLYDGTKLVDSVTVVVLGDVDGNAIVDTTDYMRVKQTFLRSFTLDGVYKEAADVDKNNIVDSTDGMRIKSHFLGTYNLYG